MGKPKNVSLFWRTSQPERLTYIHCGFIVEGPFRPVKDAQFATSESTIVLLLDRSEQLPHDECRRLSLTLHPRISCHDVSCCPYLD